VTGIIWWAIAFAFCNTPILPFAFFLTVEWKKPYNKLLLYIIIFKKKKVRRRKC